MTAFAALLLAAATLGAAPENPPAEPARGRTVERVVCQADASKSYAVFLPSSYDTGRDWPVLYLIDPSARGAAAVEHFRAAAEEYGWILAGSNDAKNGPMRTSLEAVQAVWLDTHRRFRLDPRRAYTGGFSGGARAAVLVAGLEPSVAGVIACGAGFPQGRSPDEKISFAFFGTASSTDFNFWELWLADKKLERLRKAHRFEVFDGEHEWPPALVCREAIEWMELQAIAAGSAARTGIEPLYQRRLARIAELDAAGKTIEAHEARDAAAREFRDLRDVTALAQRLAQDANDSLLQRAISEKAKHEDEERRTLLDLSAPLEKVRSGFPPPAERQLVHDLRIPDLKRRAEGKSAADALSAKRLLEILFVQTAGVLPEQLLERKEWNRALLSLAAAAEIRTDSPRLWYRRARAHAGAGARTAALADIRTAIEKGYTDRAELERDPNIAALREDPAYKEIVAKLPKS